jgi:hypothetical protein
MDDEKDELLEFKDFLALWIGNGKGKASTLRRRLADGSIPKHQPGGPGTKIGIPRSALLQRSKPINFVPTQNTDTSKADPETENKISGPKPKWRK